MTYPSPSALAGDGAGAGTETVPTLSSLIEWCSLKGSSGTCARCSSPAPPDSVTAISRGLFARRTMSLLQFLHERFVLVITPRSSLCDCGVGCIQPCQTNIMLSYTAVQPKTVLKTLMLLTCDLDPASTLT